MTVMNRIIHVDNSGGCACVIIHHTFVPENCILLVSVSKLVFDQLFANVGPALALEATNRRLSAQGTARTLTLIGDVHELC